MDWLEANKDGIVACVLAVIVAARLLLVVIPNRWLGGGLHWFERLLRLLGVDTPTRDETKDAVRSPVGRR